VCCDFVSLSAKAAEDTKKKQGKEKDGDNDDDDL